MAYAVPLLDECNCLWLLKKSLQGQKLPKSDDQKCIPRRRKSFIGHPSASSFLREEAKRVFQQPRLLSTVTDEGGVVKAHHFQSLSRNTNGIFLRYQSVQYLDWRRRKRRRCDSETRLCRLHRTHGTLCCGGTWVLAEHGGFLP